MLGTHATKNYAIKHNIHNLRVVEALLFQGIYGKSKNSQFFGIYIYIISLFIYLFLKKKIGGGGGQIKWVANKIVAEG